MAADGNRKRWIPLEFSASFLLQMLGAAASFLAALVLPLNYPELDFTSSIILGIVGGVFLLFGLINLLFGKRIAVLMQRMGMHSRVTLPREGLIYLGFMLMLAIAALLGQRNMLLLIFGMMAGPFVFNGWVVMTMLQRVNVVRRLPLSAQAGEFFSVEIDIQNNKRLLSSRLIQVRDVIEGNRMRQESGVTFVRIPPGSMRAGSYRVRITRRGRYRFGPMRISSKFPLGISERGRVQQDFADICVHPAIGRMLPEWRRREQELSEAVQRSRARVGVFEDEFHRIREFRPGDNPRSIHWRSTARRGTLMMREYEQHRESDLVVLLDLHVQPDFSEDEIEQAVSLTATICVEQTRRTSSSAYRLFIASKSNVEIQCPGGARFREAALDALAECEASSTASLDWLFRFATHSTTSASDRFVLITPRPQAAAARLSQLGEDASAKTSAVLQRILVVDAHASEMSRIFELDQQLRMMEQTRMKGQP